MAESTGIEMDDEENVQEKTPDATTEAVAEARTEKEQTGDASPVEDPGDADPVGTAAAAQTGGVQAEHVEPTVGDSSQGKTEEQRTCSREEVEQLNAKIQSLEKRARDAESELKEAKDKIQATCAEIREQERIVASMFLQVGDGSPEKIYKLIKKAAELQVEADKAKKRQKDCEDLRREKETVDAWYKATNQKYLALKKVSDADKEALAQAREALAQKSKELEDALKAIQEWDERVQADEALWNRVFQAIVPQCLSGKEWFDAFSEDLRSELQKDPIFDPAILVFTSLAELAVMERSPSDTCYEWPNQLSDVGLAVAYYMHQKKAPEADVLKMLRNFVQALQEMQILKKLKIVFKVPSLGRDFNTDEVRHKNNGASITRVNNWCIVVDGRAYCKAIVE